MANYRATLPDHVINIEENVDMDDIYAYPRELNPRDNYRATLPDHVINIEENGDMDDIYAYPRELNPRDNPRDNPTANRMNSKALELRQSRSQNECCICYSKDFGAVVFRCLHYTCSNCYKHVLMRRQLKCPLCRQEFGDTVCSDNQPR